MTRATESTNPWDALEAVSAFFDKHCSGDVNCAAPHWAIDVLHGVIHRVTPTVARYPSLASESERAALATELAEAGNRPVPSVDGFDWFA